MTARPDYYPLIALTPLGNYAIPGPPVLNGWAVGAIFPSSDANWLARHHGDWIKHADERALRSDECLDLVTAQRVTLTSLGLPLAVGLSVSPTGSGVYYALGMRVDLTDAATTYVGASALTIPPSSTFYLHARPQPDLSGPLPLSSVGELLVSINAVEAGYSQIGSGVSDATDVVSYADTSTYGLSWVPPMIFDVMIVNTLDVGVLNFDVGIGSGALGSDTLTLSPFDASQRALLAAGVTAQPLVEVQQTGSGNAVTVSGGTSAAAVAVGGGAGQAAVIASSGADALAAVIMTGSGSAAGGDALAGLTADWAFRATGANADADGLYGRTSAGASTTAAGVHGEGRGDGTIGVLAESLVGHSLVVLGDTTAPAYAAIKISPQDTDPSAGGFDGELYWHSTHKSLRTCVAGVGWRSMATYGPGNACHAVALQTPGAEITYTTAANVTILTATLTAASGNGFFGQADSAKLLITFTADVRTTIATNDYVNVFIYDMTNTPGSPIASWSGAGNAPTAGFAMYASTDYQRTVKVSYLYPVPVDGDLQIRVQMRGQTNSQRVRNAVLELQGTFA